MSLVSARAGGSAFIDKSLLESGWRGAPSCLPAGAREAKPSCPGCGAALISLGSSPRKRGPIITERPAIMGPGSRCARPGRRRRVLRCARETRPERNRFNAIGKCSNVPRHVCPARASRRARVRRALSVVSLARAGAVQHRRRRLRPLGRARAGPHRHFRRAWRRRRRTSELWRAARGFQPARQCACRRGDRVAILLPQGPAVAVSHIAIYKLGAIALPLAMLFGIDAISYRLEDSGARALITNAQGLTKLAGDAPLGLDLVLSLDGAARG